MHAKATRRAVYPDDMRPSRGGEFGGVISDVNEDRGYADGGVGIALADWQFDDYAPENHVDTLCDELPDASISSRTSPTNCRTARAT